MPSLYTVSDTHICPYHIPTRSTQTHSIYLRSARMGLSKLIGVLKSYLRSTQIQNPDSERVYVRINEIDGRISGLGGHSRQEAFGLLNQVRIYRCRRRSSTSFGTILPSSLPSFRLRQVVDNQHDINCKPAPQYSLCLGPIAKSPTSRIPVFSLFRQPLIGIPS